MRINFYFDNDKKEISSNKILLSMNNPRYTPISDLNIDLKKFIIGNFDEQNNIEENQEEVFYDLLKSEGDFSDLVNLLTSFKRYGFDNTGDYIFVVKHNNYYFVAEGNRRVMALKLLLGEFSLSKLFVDFIPENIANETTNYINENEEHDEDYSLLRKQNYEKCIKLISEIREQNDNNQWNVKLKLIEKSEEVWNYIYDKHLTGRKPGMRQWSRSKYFSDLLYMFPNGINNQNLDNVYQKIKREPNVVISDFKEAQYVYACLWYGLQNEGYINFNDKNVLDKLSKLDRPSALERKHSYSTFKRVIIEKILFIPEDKFEENYFEIDFEEKTKRIIFIDKKIRAKDVLTLIYNNWNKGVITTRPIKESKMPKFVEEIRALVNVLDDKNQMTDEELESIDPFTLNVDTLNNIISLNKNSEKIEKFEIAREVMEENEKFLHDVKNIIFTKENIDVFRIEPIHIFDILLEQYQYLSKDFHYINGMAASLRSLLDEMLLWIFYFANETEREQTDYLQNLITGKTTDIIRIIKKNITTKDITYKNLQKVYKVSDDELAKTHFKKLRDIFDNSKHDYGYDALNSFIHSSRTTFIKNFRDKYKLFIEVLEIIALFKSNINFDLFKSLNKKIISYIRTSPKLRTK